MNNDTMKKLNSINEMARIDDPNISPRTLGQCEIWIYGEDRSAMTPHFHFLRRTGVPFEIEIKLTDFTICKSKPRKGVNKNDILTWKGLENEHRLLLKWLDESNSDYAERTNKEVLINTWNQNNRNNQIKESKLNNQQLNVLCESIARAVTDTIVQALSDCIE